MENNYMAEYEKWLNSGVLTDAEKDELLAIRDDPKEIESRFYGPLEFGTAGLRGTMKVGLHHMNNYVVRHATQGFANVIIAEGEAAKQRGVAICMDCRLHSRIFPCSFLIFHADIFQKLREYLHLIRQLSKRLLLLKDYFHDHQGSKDTVARPCVFTEDDMS